MEDDLKEPLRNSLWIGQYILNEQGEPVLERDILKWGAWLESHDRHVAYTDLGFRGKVSTVFLGMDHNFLQFNNFTPVLWETIVFGGPFDQEQRRYCSRQEALEGHAEIVKMCRHNTNVTHILCWWSDWIVKSALSEFRRKHRWFKKKLSGFWTSFSTILDLSQRR